MNRLSKAKTALAVVCALFFLLGSGATCAVAPLIFPNWWTPKTAAADVDWNEILGLSVEQRQQTDAVLREQEAANRLLETEIKRIYYPKFQQIAKDTEERCKALLTPEQRTLYEEYSTGKRKRDR